MNDYCVDLDIGLSSPLRDDVDLTKFPVMPFVSITGELLNPELTKILSDLGLRTSVDEMAIMFILASNSENDIHNDLPVENGDLAKLNWSYNTDHVMKWYHIKEDRKNPAVLRPNQTGLSSYYYYPPKSVELIHSQAVGFPSLIQAGIPHNVENFQGIRRCISIPLFRNGTNVPVTMAEAKQMFAQYLG